MNFIMKVQVGLNTYSIPLKQLKTFNARPELVEG
jgi:hypothetical protein